MKWFFIMLLLVIPLTSAAIIIGDDDFNINDERGIFLERIPTNISDADINSSGNALFWRLDAGNSPPTSIWNMGGFGFNNLNMTNDVVLFDDVKLTFGTDEDLKISWETFGNRLELRPPENTDINILFQGTDNSGVLRFDEDLDRFVFLDHIQLITNEFFYFGSNAETSFIWNTSDLRINSTGNVVFADDTHIVVNGSLITDVCLSDGTNCQSVAGAEQNLTNVAFLNNTQTFTGNNTFSGNITLQDNARLSLGTQQNSQIYYDGTDSFWDLRNSGSGDLMIALEAGFPSPDPNNVHIWSGNAGAVTPGASRQLVIENDGGAGMTFLSPNTDTQRISFGDPESNNAGQIAYRHGDDIMRFRIGSATRLDYSANNFQFQEATTINTSTGSLTLSSSSESIIIDPGKNLTFNTPIGSLGCLRWDAAISTQSSSLCTQANTLDISSPVINLRASTLALGLGTTTGVTLDFDTSGTIGQFRFESASPSRFRSLFPMEFPVWFGSQLPLFFPNNISWVGAVAAQLDMNVPLVFLRGVLNATDDVCIEGGQCLSNIPANTVDTNATTECSGDQALLGNSSCASTSVFLDAHGIAYLSVSTTSHSNTGGLDVEVYAFASSNYTTYTYVNNSNPSGITYDSLSGIFDVGFTGVLDYDWTGIWHNFNNFGVNVTVKKNGVNIFQNDIQDRARNNIADDPRASFSIGQIIDVNNGDELEFFWELVDENLAGGETTQARSGNTVNMRRLS